MAVEGANTESIYLSLFQDIDSLLFNKKVRVIPLTDQQEHRSSPGALVARIDTYRVENETAENDQFWIVSDVDHWIAHGQLQQAFTEGTQKGYFFATSNPCFEMWLYLHFSRDITEMAGLTMRQQKAFLKFQLKKFLGGYNKGKYDASKFERLVDVASANARFLDTPPSATWPNSIGTNVYRLIEWIRTH